MLLGAKMLPETVKKAVLKALAELKKLDLDELLEKRYEKLRALGNFYA